MEQTNELMFHCKTCMEDLEDMGYPETPRDYARLEIALRDGRFITTCVRHEKVVLDIKADPEDPAVKEMTAKGCQCCPGRRAS